jgi:Zn-dependent metalloprotease
MVNPIFVCTNEFARSSHRVHHHQVIRAPQEEPMFKHSPGGALLLIVALVLGSGSAFGFSPTGQEFEVPLQEFAPVIPFDLAERGAAHSTAVAQIFDGRWHAQGYNTSTAKPRWIYGSGPKVSTAITTKDALRPAARDVLEQVAPTLALDSTELRLVASPNAAGKWAAHYQQTHQGVDVWGAKVSVVFAESGALMVIGSQYRQGIDVDPNPAFSASAALDLARADLPFVTEIDLSRGDPELLVLPVPVSAWEEEYHLVWRVRLTSEEPLGVWVTHIDAHDGSVVWRYNDVRLEHSGSTQSTVNNDTYCLGPVQEPMPYLRVNLAGNGSTTTDTDGNWSFPSSSGALQVTADLYGPYVDLNNYGAGGEAQFSGTAQDGVPLQVGFDGFNSRQDERDVFDGVNDVHDFFESIDPGFGYANQRMTAYVGRTDGYCPGNAWWNGTINFCEAGDGYANTGEIQNVVQHEFGHGVNDYILGSQGSTGMGEGNSDILANLMSQESIIGLGFFQNNCETGIRNADNTLVYPEHVIGQSIHFAGQVIAGFNWDAMVYMQQILGDEQGAFIAASNWHLGRVLMTPTNMPDQVFATFLADDDDGNLDNGTPHHPYYAQAAENHGFTAPAITVGVLISHTPMDDTTDPGPFDVEATIVSTEAALSPDLLKLMWRYSGGEWIEAALTAAGSDRYVGTIPMQPTGDVEYYFMAGDALGNQASLPALAPDFYFDFLVATVIDPVETDSGWVAGLPTDTATSGVWERVDPVGTSAQPENDHTASGTDCWVTGQHVSGQSDGYNDIDGGRTTLTSPVWDLTSYESVEIRYWKWYNNAAGNAPNADWWKVLVSNDGGATWTVLEETMETTPGWEAFTFAVADHFTAPGQLQLQFIAEDENEGSLVEAAIDDVAIIAVSGLSGVGEDDLQVAMVPVLDQNVPNPFNPSTVISFNLPRVGHASLKVYDVKGALVRVLLDEERPAGPQQVVWDGTGENNRPVASGVYFYRLITDGGTLDKRMLLIK